MQVKNNFLADYLDQNRQSNIFLKGPYVAPFPLPQSSPSPPVFPGSQGSYPGHIMVYQPPLHLSMYPQPPVAHGHYPQPPPEQPPQPVKEAKEPTHVIMFGSTPVVSVRHSSSDEEAEAETRAKVSEIISGCDVNDDILLFSAPSVSVQACH